MIFAAPKARKGHPQILGPISMWRSARLLPGHLEQDCVCALVCWAEGCLPGHVGGWELWGCDLALLASLWLPCGQFHF